MIGLAEWIVAVVIVLFAAFWIFYALFILAAFIWEWNKEQLLKEKGRAAKPH